MVKYESLIENYNHSNFFMNQDLKITNISSNTAYLILVIIQKFYIVKKIYI